MVSPRHIILFLFVFVFMRPHSPHAQTTIGMQTPTKITVVTQVSGTAFRPHIQLDQFSWDTGTPKRALPLGYISGRGSRGRMGLLDPLTNKLTFYGSSNQGSTTLTLQMPPNSPQAIHFCLLDQHILVLVGKEAEEKIMVFDGKGKWVQEFNSAAWDLGTGYQLIGRRDHAFFLADKYPLKIARIQPDSEQPVSFESWSHEDHQCRPNGRGALIHVTYDPETKTRNLVALDPADGNTAETQLAVDLRMLVLGLLGGDAHGNTFHYGSLPDGNKGLYRLDAAGSPEIGFAFDHAALRIDQQEIVFSGRGDHLELHWFQLSDMAHRQVITELAPETGELVGLNRSGNALVIEKNEMGLPGRLLEITPEGSTTELPLSSPQMVYRNQEIRHWMVDADGKVLVPILHEYGVSVVAMEFE